MAVKPLVRKLLKIAGIGMGILLVLLVVTYFWFVRHAESIIREIVSSKSNGTVDLTLKSITYNFSERRLNLKEAIIFNTDSVSKKTAYRIKVKNLSLQLHKLRPLLLHRELVIDSILINDPDISVMKFDTAEKRHGSLAREIGDVYHSIQQALNLFQIDHFRIANGRFSLDNRARVDWQPVTISNIYFAINHIQVGGDKKDDNVFHFTDDIEFRTDHQVITFPDKRYRMSFGKFRIHVRNGEIALDSCTIKTTGLRQQAVDVHLFFDKLRFINIDFPALYGNGMIQADSMYATNPVLNLHVKIDSTRQRHAPPVRMDTLLRHLGVNTRLKYMGVKNVSTSVVTDHGVQSATFKTNGDDFEMRDLVIDRHAKEPVSVGRFDMAIRGYTSLNKDSTYRFKFDSIRIINSNILLNNFSINSLEKAPVVRHHQLPLLELDSLSWEELIFRRHVQAKQAILYRPEIHYTKMIRSKSGRKLSLYSMLNSIDKIMSLERIRIIDGNVFFEPNPTTKLQLHQVDLTVQTNRFLAARSTGMLGDAVDSLHFKTGSIHTGKLQASITNGSFTGNGTRLQAEDATIRNLAGNLTIRAKGLHMADIAINDSSEHISIGSLGWKEANVAIRTGAPKENAAAPPALSVLASRIEGANTQLSLTTPGSTLHTLITKLSLRDVARNAGTPIKTGAVIIEGKHLQFTGKDLLCNTGDYALRDRAPSHINNLRITHQNDRDSFIAAVPRVDLVPDIAALLEGHIVAGSISLQTPSVWAKLGAPAAKAASAPPTAKPLPVMHIGKITLAQPVIHIEQEKDSHALRLQWNQGKDPAHNQWVVEEIKQDGKEPLTIGKLALSGTDVSFTRHSAKSLLLKPQRIQLVLTNTKLPADTHHDIPWSTIVSHFDLRDLRLDGIGKDSGRLNLASLTLEQLHLQAGQKPQEWLDNSPHFYLRDLSGDLHSSKNDVRWQGLRYHQQQRLLQVDSFAYRPVLDREAWVAAQPWQTDYIQLNTGRIDLHRLDLHRLLNDSLVHISMVQVQSPFISVYRDKRPPRQPNVIRDLPVNQLKGLPFKLKMDSLVVTEGKVQYEELSEKTNKSGIIPIGRLNATLLNVKSYAHEPHDSLKLQARAALFDSIDVSLRLHESYSDSLAAFLMTTRIGRANLLLLNSAVEPLASVRIRTGYLDTLTMRAIGREYLSYGEMHMLYRQLNVEFLQGGDGEKKTFMTKAITFVANAFVIKSRNRGKTGIIYFERLRDRSIFNYMIKMLLSGAGTSIGAKSNKKYIKHYKRELHKQQLPPINYH